MKDAAQEFELSVTAIQSGAEQTAVESVRPMIPTSPPRPKVRKRF